MASTSPIASDSTRPDLTLPLARGASALAFVTPCAAEKDPQEVLLPALERYRSLRIRRVHAAAEALGIDFLILSGELGLLEARTPIPFYDHLLRAHEVPEHAARVAVQLNSRGTRQLVFFSEAPEIDGQLLPYLACLEAAATEAGVEVIFLHLEEPIA